MKHFYLGHGTFIFIGMLAAFAAQSADLTIRLDARDIVRKRVHTTIGLAVRPGPLTLVYPKWLPGEHGPTGPLESIIGLEIKANGQSLAWSRDPLDMYALRITVPGGVDRIDIALESGLATDGGGFSSGPSSSEQLAVVSWNQFVMFPKGRDAEQLSASASITPPAGWSIASALEFKATNAGTIEFESASLMRLIDSPVQMGRYLKRIELNGSEPRADIQHSISIAADSAAALTVPADFAQGYNRLVAESGALFGTRLYRHYTWLLSLSDQVAHMGLEHHESSDDRLDENALSDPDLRMTSVAGLLGHEYVHSWNGKYRRPSGLLSPDYQKPMDGSLLWVYEGLTQLWGDVLPTRAGLETPEFYRELLALDAGIFDVRVGAQWRPMSDTAVAAQALYPAPGAWRSSRRGPDFYEASVFLWLDVDAQLREQSHGSITLDDFMKRFCAGVNGAAQLKPYVEQDVYDTLNAIAPRDWRAFVHRHLDRTGTATILAALERTGWQLTYSAEKNSVIESVQKQSKTTSRQWSIGVRLDKDAKIMDTIEDRAAARAGASPGMTVIAVNGRKYSVDVLDAAITEAHTARKPIALLVENGDFYRTLLLEYYDGPRYPHLTRIDGRPDMLSSVIAPHMK